ncbi:carbohydrate ABC transporter permease [Microbacterium sp. zg.Y1090]|uniref:carbohydrate ABC transporter permease n=1 Tax=Microbacterium TaxID=33882 RepID=UPI00214C1821|nr:MULTISPECIES: carbohydrate ABC transporter permease [unclassified Microbacterium]MCR2813819.1 carbohydrate ABC transporter permease [Microbacterium sp. zg.Y1084]MCR2819667.1 carbohydrate ABC transporter permease [Microbacterium sp. zg.Y1090]MDL5487515.1 carbohydrate ABC transporter permease [Microbacterium sp. zg-Y1211]WIM29788.1 carbohydrate ABC transporter permease [Microbacterium sp. zg-Y1090]
MPRRMSDRLFRPAVQGGIKDSRSYTVFRMVNAGLIVVICFVTLYPFLNVIAQAFSSEAYINSGQVNLIPRGFNVTTFGYVMGDPMFWRNYGNTVLYTVVATVIAMILTTTFAYALSKRNLKGRSFFIGVAVFTMFFNGGLIPNYILINTLGFKNTLWAIVIPNAISVFNLLVMKAFFENFPEDLEEAAAIDGLNTYGILWKIVLPLSKAVIATMVLFYAVSFWNQWFTAFLYMDRAELYPVTVYLRNMLAAATGTEALGTGGTGEASQVASNVKAVTMLLTVLPIVCLYPFIQKYFVSGVMLGSVKQ